MNRNLAEISSKVSFFFLLILKLYPCFADGGTGMFSCHLMPRTGFELTNVSGVAPTEDFLKDALPTELLDKPEL